MASFCYRIRSTQKNKLVKIQVLFTVGRGNQFYVDSQYMVLTDAWDNKAASPFPMISPSSRGAS